MSPKKNKQSIKTERETQLEGILNATPDAMLLINEEGGILMANAQAANMFGYLQEELVKFSVENLIAENYRSQHLENRSAYLKQPEVITAGVERDLFALHKDGSQFPVEVSLSHYTLDVENVVVLCSIRNVTERKQIEHLISAQRDLARLIAMKASEEDVWMECFRTALLVSGFDAGGFYLFDKFSRTFDLIYHEGLSDDFVKAVTSFSEDTPNVQIILKGITTCFTEAELHVQEYYRIEGLRALAVIPIHNHGQVLGCLNIASRKYDHVPTQSRIALETIAAEIGNVIFHKQTEVELERSNDQLRQTLAAARMGTWRYYIATNRMILSPEAAQILGTDQFENDLSKMIDYVHPEDRKKAAQALEDILTQKEISTLEYRIFRASGDLLWVTNYLKLECNTDGTPIMVSGLIQDITERKRVEEGRRETDERYYLLFRNMVQGVVFQDKDGRIIHANPAAEKILGLSMDQMMGRASIDPRWHSIHEDGSAFPGEDHPAIVALRTGKPVYDVVMGVFNPETNTYRWININATPRFFNSSETPYQVFATFEDITERKQAELELRESEKRLRSMLEISQAMSASLEMDSVLQIIVENATNLLELDSGAIYTLKGEGLYLEATTPPLPTGFPDQLRHAYLADHPHIQTALSSGSTVVVADLMSTELSSAEKLVAESRGLRSILYIPLMILEKAIGVLMIASVNRLRTFTEDDIALYTGFSGQAAQTIENIRLYEAEHKNTAELKAQIGERKLAEDNLRASEKKYRDLINGMNDTVWVIDLDSRFLDVNDAAVRTLGYSREELLSMKVSDIDTAINPEQIQQSINKLHGEKLQVFETCHKDKDGREFPVEVSSSLISYMGRTVVMSIARDITERKKAEESLNKSQSLLKEAQRIARIGHMEWNGRDQALICSDEIYDIFELPRGTVVDQNILGQMLSPEERERLLQLDLLAMQQRADVEYEFSIRLKDGSIRWLHQRGQFTYDENGNATRMMIIVQDITERKNTEHTLKENRSRLEMALKGANAGMWDWNVQTGETVFNERWAEIVGYSLKELEPISIKTWSDLCHPDDLQRSEALLQKHFSGETEFYECEARMKHKNGVWVWVLDQGRVMEWDEEGKPVHMFGTHLDITKQKREELYTQAVLRLTNISYETYDMEYLMRAMLDEAEALTGSAIGFFHFVDANQNSISLQAWSTNTLTNLCTAEGKGQHYSVEEAGIWADAIRSGEPHIYNDYPSLSHRKGLPEGHAPVTRLISLPVKRNSLVVAALGVGNKAQDYTEQDLDILKNLAETVLDIIMRKRAEEALRTNEERLRTVADFTYDMEFWMDENKTLLYMSPSSKRITGYEREQFLKDPSLMQRIIHPEDQPVFEQHSVEEFDLPDSHSLDFRIITAAGEMRWINHTCQAVTGEDGKFHGRRVSHRDVTEQRLVLKELRDSEEKYRGLLESLESVVASVDLNGRFLYMNDTAAEQMGGVPAQFIGKTMYEMFPPQVADQQMRDIQIVFAEDKGMVFENLSYVKGQPHWYRTSIEPLHGENGQVISVLVNSTDIDELKTMQYELQELNRTLEEKVTQRTAEVQDLYDNAPTGYHSIDADGKYVRVNQTELNWLGYSREEMIGRTAAEFLTEATRTNYTEGFVLLAQRGWLKDMEIEFVRKDGSILPVLLNATAIYDEAGNFLMSRTTVFDITERKQAENEIKRNNNFTSALLNAVPTPVFYKDREGRYLGCNQSFVELIGKTASEIRGKLPHEIWEVTHADVYRQKDLELMQSTERQVYEAVVTDKNGTARPVIFVKDLFHDEDGNVAGLVGAFIDISDRKQAELAIRESEATYRALFENSNDGIFLMSATGEELRANQRALDLLGYTLDEYLNLGHINQNPFSIEPEQRKDADEKLEALLRGEKVPLYERIFTAKDGHKVPVEINLSPIRDANGKIFMVQSVVRDIAERKAAEDKLRNINKELEHALRVKDEFLANMSHELRTPLNGILGFSEILLSNDFGALSERQKKYVASIESSGKHLLGLINDLLDLAKIEAGKLELLPENVIISELCQSSLMFVKQMALKKNIQLAFKQDIDTPFLIGDQRRLKQILVNLLSNAVKFTPENGKVTLRVFADTQNNGFNFSVEDTGIGISAEDLKRLFTPFTQVDTSLTRQNEGTGLGLALVQKLAELHGGGVTVKSEVGRGSMFTLCIPGIHTTGFDAKNADQNMDENIVETTQSKTTHKGKILLAEDIESNIEIFRDYLVFQGYELFYAMNGQEALDQAKQVLPDLILMDIQMPVMDGLEAIRRLRTDPRFATVPIIALTALAMAGDRERCLEAGATEYVSKPVNLKKLTKMIQVLLEAKRP